MHSDLLADIGKAVIAAGLVGLPAYALGIPLILAYLLAGVAIGPHLGLSLIQDAQSIAGISEIGLVFLMFILGLEINLKKLLQTGRAVTLAAVTQIFGGLILGVAVFHYAGFGVGRFDLVYLAVACVLSSTLIVVKILSDLMLLDSLPSRITVGILVLQDLFAIGFLALQKDLAHLDPMAIIGSMSRVTVLILVSWGLARYLLPGMFRKAGRQPELLLILAMAWCFAMCGLAGYLDLSLEMGSLVAGIAIASFPYHTDVVAKISSLRDFFITLFFVSLGLQIRTPSLEVLQLAAVVSGFVMISRVVTIFPILHRLGFANRASLVPGINLSQLSEFSLVLAALGVSYGHIRQDILSAFILSLVGTALVSSVLIPRAHKIFKFLNPKLIAVGYADHLSEAARIADEQSVREIPCIAILGFYREASSLLFEMQRRYSSEYMSRVLIVDYNPEVHDILKKRQLNCRYGDISSVDTLRHLNLHEAKTIISTIPDKVLKGTTNLKLLKTLKKIAPNASIIVTAENMPLALEMYQHGASYVFIPRVIAATYLIDVLERLQVNGADSIRPSAADYISSRPEVIP